MLQEFIDKISNLSSIINNSKRMAVITGAGISTSAGIPDFRGPNGLYSRADIPADLLFSIDFFRKDPTLFYNHIGILMDAFDTAEPTTAHHSIAELESSGHVAVVITQNIDDLHHRAGSKKIIPVHGDFRHYQCILCGDKQNSSADIREIVRKKDVPRCACGGALKPSVVFFGEQVIGIQESIELVGKADCVIVIGSSLLVQPAASLPRFRQTSVPLVIINIGSTGFDREADLVFDDDIDTVFTALKNYP